MSDTPTIGHAAFHPHGAPSIPNPKRTAIDYHFDQLMSADEQRRIGATPDKSHGMRVMRTLDNYERMRTALHAIADEAVKHHEHNPESGAARLPEGYKRILNLAAAALQ